MPRYAGAVDALRKRGAVSLVGNAVALAMESSLFDGGGGLH